MRSATQSGNERLAKKLPTARKFATGKKKQQQRNGMAGVRSMNESHGVGAQGHLSNHGKKRRWSADGDDDPGEEGVTRGGPRCREEEGC